VHNVDAIHAKLEQTSLFGAVWASESLLARTRCGGVPASLATADASISSRLDGAQKKSGPQSIALHDPDWFQTAIAINASRPTRRGNDDYMS